MSRTEPVQCATCGWTGQSSDLDDDGGGASCPVCDEAIPISH